VRTFIRLLLKYKSVTGAGEIAAELVATSKRVKRVAALLVNGNECEFVGVAIPETTSFDETVRLVDTLGKLKVPVGRILINNVVPFRAAEECAFCDQRHRRQERVVKRYDLHFNRSARLFVAPQQPFEVNGPARLQEHFASWRELRLPRHPARRV
jgi:anion-transporting  ArsA/GET3 family ATPase